HGAWRKSGGVWAQAVEVDVAALDDLAARLGALVAAHAGALLERKTASVCAHYRLVRGPERASFLAGASALLEGWLREHPGFAPLEVIEAIEVRARHAHKGSAPPWARGLAGEGARCVALGDDVTDEDTFAALGPRDDAVLVGPGGRPTAARWRLDDPAAARAFLRWLLAAREGGSAGGEAALPGPIVLGGAGAAGPGAPGGAAAARGAPSGAPRAPGRLRGRCEPRGACGGAANRGPASVFLVHDRRFRCPSPAWPPWPAPVSPPPPARPIERRRPGRARPRPRRPRGLRRAPQRPPARPRCGSARGPGPSATRPASRSRRASASSRGASTSTSC
ncbi:MAG TPA: trehalose-phosphatase, partial [Polyangiaceae bacterium]|nr:trehalose-phosphatase [Polyangiaceae bacterium]